MSIVCDDRRREVRKSLQQLRQNTTQPAFFDSVCVLIKQYLQDTSNTQPYTDAINILITENFTPDQAEFLLRSAFPEIDGGGPGSGW